MFKRFGNLSSSEKLRKLLIPAGVTTLSIAIYQGVQLRDQYNKNRKLDPPNGPHFGIEKWVEKIRVVKDEILDSIKGNDSIVTRGINKVKEVLDEIEEKRESTTPKPVNENSGLLKGTAIKALNDHAPAQLQQSVRQYPDKKKIKLLVLGDSLVAGVGNDDLSRSPVLRKLLLEC